MNVSCSAIPRPPLEKPTLRLEFPILATRAIVEIKMGKPSAFQEFRVLEAHIGCQVIP
jgi:hypothetical protein